MEVDAVGRVDPEHARLAPPSRRGGPIGSRERPGERLLGRVPGLQRDVEDGAVTGQEAVRGPLEQNSAAEPPGRLPGQRVDDPVEVVARQVHSPGELRAGRVVFVERLGQYRHEGGEHIRRVGHGAILRPTETKRLIAIAVSAQSEGISERRSVDQ